MRVETFRKGKKWGFRVVRDKAVVGKSRKLYPTKDEAATVGRNHKEALLGGIDPVTGKKKR